MAIKIKEKAKKLAKKGVKVAEAAVNIHTLGMYNVGKEKLKSRACTKKGGVWKGGKCIPKKEIRKGKSKSRDWYPEKVPGQVRNEMIERKIISQVKKGSRRKGRPV